MQPKATANARAEATKRLGEYGSGWRKGRGTRTVFGSRRVSDGLEHTMATPSSPQGTNSICQTAPPCLGFPWQPLFYGLRKCEVRCWDLLLVSRRHNPMVLGVLGEQSCLWELICYADKKEIHSDSSKASQNFFQSWLFQYCSAPFPTGMWTPRLHFPKKILTDIWTILKAEGGRVFSLFSFCSWREQKMYRGGAGYEEVP